MVELEDYITRQIEWSYRTFGPGKRSNGISEHIVKELDEIRSDPDDAREWIDVIILALDGAWRAGLSPSDIVRELATKQAINFARRWPAPTSEDRAVEHDRSFDPAPLVTGGDNG